MNEHITEPTVPTLDNDQIDALMAKLHADAVSPEGEVDLDGNTYSDGDSEDAQSEGAYISEDETSRQLN